MAWPSASARTKNWGTEILTDTDLEAQYDLLHSYFNDSLNATTGHAHTGGTSDGPKISAATGLTIASQAQGDLLYASSSSAFARLGAGTAGMFLKTLGASANPAWAYAPIFKMGTTTYDLSTASGTQAITGVGFTPRLVIILANQTGNARTSIGIDDGTNHYSVYMADAGNAFRTATATSINADSTTTGQSGYISALGADGFTITWTKTGSPTGTFTLMYLCIQ